MSRFEDWLIAHDQSEELRERFWNVVLVSALSETLDRVDVGYARKVFVDTFLSNRTGWRMQVPTAPLDTLFNETVKEWLEARGVDVRTSADVRQLEQVNGRVKSVLLRRRGRVWRAKRLLWLCLIRASASCWLRRRIPHRN